MKKTSDFISFFIAFLVFGVIIFGIKSNNIDATDYYNENTSSKSTRSTEDFLFYTYKFIKRDGDGEIQAHIEFNVENIDNMYFEAYESATGGTAVKSKQVRILSSNNANKTMKAEGTVNVSGYPQNKVWYVIFKSISTKNGVKYATTQYNLRQMVLPPPTIHSAPIPEQEPFSANFKLKYTPNPLENSASYNLKDSEVCMSYRKRNTSNNYDDTKCSKGAFDKSQMLIDTINYWSSDRIDTFNSYNQNNKVYGNGLLVPNSDYKLTIKAKNSSNSDPNIAFGSTQTVYFSTKPVDLQLSNIDSDITDMYNPNVYGTLSYTPTTTVPPCNGAGCWTLSDYYSEKDSVFTYKENNKPVVSNPSKFTVKLNKNNNEFSINWNRDIKNTNGVARGNTNYVLAGDVATRFGKKDFSKLFTTNIKQAIKKTKIVNSTLEISGEVDNNTNDILSYKVELDENQSGNYIDFTNSTTVNSDTGTFEAIIPDGLFKYNTTYNIRTTFKGVNGNDNIVIEEFKTPYTAYAHWVTSDNELFEKQSYFIENGSTINPPTEDKFHEGLTYKYIGWLNENQNPLIDTPNKSLATLSSHNQVIKLVYAIDFGDKLIMTNTPPDFDFDNLKIAFGSNVVGLEKDRYDEYSQNNGFNIKVADGRQNNNVWSLSATMSPYKLLDTEKYLENTKLAFQGELRKIKNPAISLNEEEIPTENLPIFNRDIMLNADNSEKLLMQAIDTTNPGIWIYKMAFDQIKLVNSDSNKAKKGEQYHSKITWSLNDTPTG